MSSYGLEIQIRLRSIGCSYQTQCVVKTANDSLRVKLKYNLPFSIVLDALFFPKYLRLYSFQFYLGTLARPAGKKVRIQNFRGQTKCMMGNAKIES